MSQRIEKVNELIKNQLGQIIIKELELPENLMITITKVETSPDLKSAKIFISVLPENMRGTALLILTKNAGVLHRALNKLIKIKFTPNLKFFIDEQEIFAEEVEKILDEIKR
ncbi:30S ribosome-binding factor RbfA [Candidatus Falkowbacteria bacterium]|nr:30S ribosome-binding factor RbfA [Candidatus Falkowbacteria bacterium]